MIVNRPGSARVHVEIDDAHIDDVLSRFHAIDGDPGRFAAFVSAYSMQ